jgi:hypothetical protein
MKPNLNKGWLASIFFLLALGHLQAQPTLVSSVPANAATGISTTADVVFTFNEPIATNESAAIFYNLSAGGTLVAAIETWNSNNTVLTCAPLPSFPANSEIQWVVLFYDANTNDSIPGYAVGTFNTSTSSGGGGAGSGTNKYTAFDILKGIYYQQTSAAAPSLETNIPPYIFSASVSLSSNQSVSGVTVQLPNSSVSNLTSSFFTPTDYTLAEETTNQAALDALFGNGTYTFNVTGSQSNVQAQVNLPASLPQPPAPQVSNFAASQAVDATQPFTLTWSPFTGGSASDFIFVTVGPFSTPQPTTDGALPGTATSTVIPANTFQPGNSYNGYVTFYHYNIATNKAAGYVTLAIRFATTQFDLNTIGTGGGGAGPINLTSPSFNGTTFSFDVDSDLGQALIVQYATDLAGPWSLLQATTNTTGTVSISDSAHHSGGHVFYRVIAGP